MDRFRALQAFVAVAEHSGFAPAAAALRISPTAVTRLIAGLEREIGVRLFARSTRVVRLTEQGARFAADARRILADLAEAESEASGAAQALKGRIRLTAPVLFGRSHVAPLLLDFAGRYPEISVDLLLLDRVADLVEEGIDLAVRIADPETALATVRVGAVGRVLCAAPSYLARRGVPRTVKELDRHDGIELTSASARQWTFRQGSAERQAHPRLVFSSNSPDVSVAACLAGLGVARFMTYQVRNEIAARSLVPLLSAFEPAPQPVHLVHSRQRPAPRRVLLLLDHLKEGLRGQFNRE